MCVVSWWDRLRATPEVAFARVALARSWAAVGVVNRSHQRGLELLAPIAVPSCDQDEELPLEKCSQLV